MTLGAMWSLRTHLAPSPRWCLGNSRWEALIDCTGVSPPLSSEPHNTLHTQVGVECTQQSTAASNSGCLTGGAIVTGKEGGIRRLLGRWRVDRNAIQTPSLSHQPWPDSLNHSLILLTLSQTKHPCIIVSKWFCTTLLHVHVCRYHKTHARWQG